MTLKQAERLRQKITAIRRSLAAEKKKFGAFDDSRGLRYLVLRYHVQLGDFKGGLTYLRWFQKNFPDDAGFPDFLFEWALILFRSGKIRDAAQKVVETHRADIHLLDAFLNRPSTPSEPWEHAPLDIPSYAPYFKSLGGQTNLADFAEWLAAFTVTEEFLTSSQRFIDLNRQLHGETDLEKRRYLVRQLYPVNETGNGAWFRRKTTGGAPVQFTFAQHLLRLAMLPEFLGEFRPQLETHKLDYVRIRATPLQPGGSLTLTQSKFLGTPFLPVGTPYPHDVLGKPMILLAQINFAEAPALAAYPTDGILQLFVSPTEWYNMDPKDYRILYHPDAQAAAQTNFSFLTPDLYTESPINVEHSLAFSLETEYGGAADCRFTMDFAGKDYYDYHETLPQDQQDQLDTYCFNMGHKIGGYATFTQSDPRCYSAGQRDDVLLLQLDSDDEILWGDVGVANIFISPEALQARQFDRAYFNWDCH